MASGPPSSPQVPFLVAFGRQLTTLAGPARVAARLRWMLCIVGALQAASPIYLPYGLKIQPVDLIRFSDAGGWIVSGQFSRVYAGSWMQAGPFELVGSWLLFPLGQQHRARYVLAGLDGQLWLRLLIGAALMAGVMLMARQLRRLHDLPTSARMELAVGTAAVLMAVSLRFWSGGHLAQFGVPIFWIYGASLAARGRTTAAGLVIGLSAGWELWGVLAAGVLLAERDPGRLLRGIAAFVAGAVVCYLPFVVTGHFAMFDLDWPLIQPTLIGTLFPHLTHFTWQLRLLQGGAAGLAGVWVTLMLGRRRDMIWLAPLAVQVVRMILDPMILFYYWWPVLILILAGVALLHLWCSAARTGLVLALVAVPVVEARYSHHWDNTPWPLILALALIIPLVVLVRREEPAARSQSTPWSTAELQPADV